MADFDSEPIYGAYYRDLNPETGLKIMRGLYKVASRTTAAAAAAYAADTLNPFMDLNDTAAVIGGNGLCFTILSAGTLYLCREEGANLAPKTKNQG